MALPDYSGRNDRLSALRWACRSKGCRSQKQQAKDANGRRNHKWNLTIYAAKNSRAMNTEAPDDTQLSGCLILFRHLP